MIRRHPLIGSAGSKYGLIYTDNNAVFLERQTANGAITDSKKLKIKIKELKGKSFVWNQLVKDEYKNKAISFDNSQGTASRYTSTGISCSGYNSSINGHKLYAKADIINNGGDSDDPDYVYFADSNQSNIVGGRIITANTTATISTRVNYRVRAGKNVNAFITVKLIDLTLLGIDNLTTVEEVETWLANNVGDFPYYAFNSGTILNNKFNIFESVEFNQWDEEWELGTLDSQGQNSPSNSRIRTKNYIPILNSVTYYCKMGTFTGTLGTMAFYDAKKQFMVLKYPEVGNFTPPAGAAFMRIAFYITYGDTYNHDICINLSNLIHNGQYKPYKSHIINLNLTTLIGKVNGEGESVIICPDGLKSAGTVYDEGIIKNGYLTKIIKRINVVDMGNLRWVKRNTDNKFQTSVLTDIAMDKTVTNIICSKYVTETIPGHTNVTDKKVGELSAGGLTNGQIIVADSTFENSDAADFKAAMSGVLLNYELNAPITYILDNPIYVGTYGHSYGVERILPQNTEEPYTTPASMIIDYLAKG